MFKLIAPTTTGNFIVGKVYDRECTAQDGTPIVIDEDGVEVNIWDYTADCIPICWSQG